MAMAFEQRVAGAVAKAGLRAKPGPKKEAGIKGAIGRGKPNHSEWISGEIPVENPTSEMATPRSRKKDKKDSLSTARWSCKSQAASAIRSVVIAHSWSCLNAISHLPLQKIDKPGQWPA
jgi:hypothetical protein